MRVNTDSFKMKFGLILNTGTRRPISYWLLSLVTDRADAILVDHLARGLAVPRYLFSTCNSSTKIKCGKIAKCIVTAANKALALQVSKDGIDEEHEKTEPPGFEKLDMESSDQVKDSISSTPEISKIARQRKGKLTSTCPCFSAGKIA